MLAKTITTRSLKATSTYLIILIYAVMSVFVKVLKISFALTVSETDTIQYVDVKIYIGKFAVRLKYN